MLSPNSRSSLSPFGLMDFFFVSDAYLLVFKLNNYYGTDESVEFTYAITA